MHAVDRASISGGGSERQEFLYMSRAAFQDAPLSRRTRRSDMTADIQTAAGGRPTLASPDVTGRRGRQSRVEPTN